MRWKAGVSLSRATLKWIIHQSASLAPRPVCISGLACTINTQIRAPAGYTRTPLKKTSSPLSSLSLPETTEALNWQRPPSLRVEERTCTCSAAPPRGPAFIGSTLRARHKRAGGRRACLLPVRGLLHSVEAIAFMSTGSGGESVRTFVREAKKDELARTRGGKHGRTGLNESHVLVSREVQKLCCHLTSRSISNPSCPQTHDNG